MKKHQTYLVLLLAMLLCGSVNAHVNHYIGAYAQVGEWSLLPSKSEYSGSLGVAGGLGFLYELQAGKKYSPTRFLFDVGVGASAGMTAYIQSSNTTDPLLHQQALPQPNQQPLYFDYVYELRDRRDRYDNMAIQVPLMVGLQHKRFYMLAGMKVYANVWTQANYSAKIDTYGRFEDIDDLRNMPQYQFFNGITKKGSVTTNLNLDMDLSFEIGGRLGTVAYSVGYDVPKRKIEYRLAAFVDYGLLDLHTKGTKSPLVKPQVYDINPSSPNYVYQSQSMIKNLSMNDIMSTRDFASKVQNLMVGIKFTVLFQMPEEGKCVICRDGYTKSGRSHSTRRGMQYEE